MSVVQLNTLYVSTDGASLHKDHETVVVKVEGSTRIQVPLLHLGGVVCLARAVISPELMAACIEAGIHISYFGYSGRFLARVEGVPGGNVLLRRTQYRAADDQEQSLAIARAMIVGKLVNARIYLRHVRRDAASERQEALGQAADRMAIHSRAAMAAQSLESLRGVEGIGAKEYFAVYSLVLKRNEQDFAFAGRSRRPPRDRVNALLSFGYALLMQDCAGALAGVGLDPAVGYLHEDRPGRLALALDLMEELRVPVVDRLVATLINREQIQPDDLTEQEGGSWRLSDAGRKTFVTAYQEAKRAEVHHEFLEQETVWGRVPHLQALLLARVLRGDIEVYPPFSIR